MAENKLIVQVPSTRIDVAAEYVSSLTCAASATTQAIVSQFQRWHVRCAHSQVRSLGTVPQTLDMVGGNVKSIVEIHRKMKALGIH